jgi:hypothetical protein
VPKKESKRAIAAKNKLAELLDIAVPGTAPTDGPSGDTIKKDISREAESVLVFLEHPKSFMAVKCNWCSKDFLVDRGNVGYCSDSCRSSKLKSQGISWDWSKESSERWIDFKTGESVEPWIVTTDFVELLKSKLGISSRNCQCG